MISQEGQVRNKASSKYSWWPWGSNWKRWLGGEGHFWSKGEPGRRLRSNEEEMGSESGRAGRLRRKEGLGLHSRGGQEGRGLDSSHQEGAGNLVPADLGRRSF